MENNKKYNVNYVKVATEMAKFVEEKDSLYGNALFNMVDEYGMDYALSKITEKLFRLKQLKKLGKEDHSESFLDSLKDLWGYAFLTILYLEQVQKQEESNDEIEEDEDYDYSDDIQEDIQDDEDDDCSTHFNILIEDCKRRLSELDNVVNHLIKEINDNQKDDIEKCKKESHVSDIDIEMPYFVDKSDGSKVYADHIISDFPHWFNLSTNREGDNKIPEGFKDKIIGEIINNITGKSGKEKQKIDLNGYFMVDAVKLIKDDIDKYLSKNTEFNKRKK